MLPEKWSVEITDENMSILGKWRDVGSLSEKGYLLSCAHGAKGYHVRDLDEHTKFPTITWEEFEMYVLETKPKIPIYEIF